MRDSANVMWRVGAAAVSARTWLMGALTSLLLLGCGGGGGGGSSCDPLVTPTPDLMTGVTTTSTSSFEAEVAIAEDPNSGTVYVATVEAIKAPQTPVAGTGPGQNNGQTECIIEKQVRVYQSQQGAGWALIPSSTMLGTTAALGGTAGPIWVSDPWLDVASDGRVYLSVLSGVGSASCATALPTPVTDAGDEVQLWVLPPGGAFTQLAVDGTGTSVISAGTNASNMGGGNLDHPRMAVNPTNPNEVVITYMGFNATPNMPDQVRTLRPDGSGTFVVASTGLSSVPFGAQSFPQPAFDSTGTLYIASAASTAGPTVGRFTKNAATQNWNVTGAPTGAPTATLPANTTTNRLFALGLLFPIDPTPTVEIVGNTLFMAYTVDRLSPPVTNGIDPGVEFTTVDATTLTGWSTPVSVSRPRAWAQAMDVDPRTNTIDFGYYSFDGPSMGATPSNVFMNSYFERRDMTTPTNVTVGPVAVSPSPPALVDIPGRKPIDPRVFPGEYLALASNGDKAFIRGER